MPDRNTYTRSARAKDIGIKKNFTGMSLVWKRLARWLKKDARICQGWCTGADGGQDAQGRNVGEEDADDERADCRGDRCAVHAPRRRLLEDTRATRARREQVTESFALSDPSPSYTSHRTKKNLPPLHHDKGEEVNALCFKESVLC